MRDLEFLALTDWLADGASAAAGSAEAELAADWSRAVSAARWARLRTPTEGTELDGTTRSA